MSETEIETGTDIVSVEGLEQYPAVQADLSGTLAVLKENVGGSLREFDLTRIKVPSGGGTTWEIPGLTGIQETKEIQGIIVYWKLARAFWKDSFENSGGGTPPDCSSQDCQIGVGEPGGECFNCPLAQFGSADKGEGQACKQMRVMFIMRPGRNLPSVVMAPPTSLKGANAYFLGLADEGRHFSSVVTTFRLEKDKNNTGIDYSKIVMSTTPELVLGAEAAAKTRAYADAMRGMFENIDLAPEDFQAGVA